LEKNSDDLVDLFKQSNECALKMVEETKRVEREYIRLLSKYDSDMINRIISMTSCSIFDVEDYINRVQFTKEGLWLFDTSSLQELSEQLNSTNQDHITQLKSQLKYCKNQLQRLNIERELNKLYKNKEKN